jgi:hypothetical protein
VVAGRPRNFSGRRVDEDDVVVLSAVARSRTPENPSSVRRSGLAAVWHDFREARFRQELTLVSLDLAEVYLAQQKARQAVRLLRAFRPTLARWRMREEGLARWLLLIDAAPGDSARAQALARETTRYYRRAWPRVVPLAADPGAD